jgi:hypothetical protein
MPDARLLDLGESGALTAPKALEAEARRMLSDPRASDAIRSFHRQWLALAKLDALSKDQRQYPDFTPALKDAMKEETMRFADDLFRNGDRSFRTLLTAPYSFVDASLAKLYGVAAPPSGFARTDMPAGQRSGVLTQAGMLAVTSATDSVGPIHRGKFVRLALLCETIPDPPKGVDITPPKVDPAQTTRQRLAQHATDPSCATCHALMDPIGFGFQHYDGSGRWLTMDGSFPVDATGELTLTEDADGPFDGALQLGQRLAGSHEAQRCMARQWVRFALGRFDTRGEGCFVASMAQAFANAKLDLRELLVAVATNDLFRNRRLAN